METLVLSIHIVLAVCLVVLVLLQQGKGADMGAVMGSGGANSLFGVSGASNLLVKMTTSVAVAFMLTSVLLVRFAAGRSGVGVPTNDPLSGSGLAGVAAAAATATPSSPGAEASPVGAPVVATAVSPVAPPVAASPVAPSSTTSQPATPASK
jgi:preprotein translocase subunit SecG